MLAFLQPLPFCIRPPWTLTTFHVRDVDTSQLESPGLRGAALWPACPPPPHFWRMFKSWFSIGSSCLLFALLEVGSLEELGRGRKRKQGCLSALPRPCLQATASLLCWTRIPRIANSQTHPYLHLSTKVLSKQEVELPFCLAAGEATLVLFFIHMANEELAHLGLTS